MSTSSFQEVVTLDQVNNGAISELFKVEHQKLLNNLADENTSWKTQREITIKLKVKLTSEERTNAVSMVEVTTKTAPPKPNEQIIALSSDGRNVSAYAQKPAEQKEFDNITNIEEAK